MHDERWLELIFTCSNKCSRFSTLHSRPKQLQTCPGFFLKSLLESPGNLFSQICRHPVADINTATSDGARCLEVGGGGTRKSGLTGGLSRAPYAGVCKFGLITRPIFSNSGGYVPLQTPVAPSLTATSIFHTAEQFNIIWSKCSNESRPAANICSFNFREFSTFVKTKCMHAKVPSHTVYSKKVFTTVGSFIPSYRERIINNN